MIHGEAGDDTIHGMTGNDVLFGDGQDDDIYGGSRQRPDLRRHRRRRHPRRRRPDPHQPQRPDRAALRPRPRPTSQTNCSALPGPFTGAVDQHHRRSCKKTVDLAAVRRWAATTSSTAAWATTSSTAAPATTPSPAPRRDARVLRPRSPQTDGQALGLRTRPTRWATTRSTRKLAAYDANNPRPRSRASSSTSTPTVDESTGAPILVNGQPIKIDDGNDVLFGDNGNDWLVGGTDNDRCSAARGDDLLNADDNLDTNGGLNDQPDAPLFADRRLRLRRRRPRRADRQHRRRPAVRLDGRVQQLHRAVQPLRRADRQPPAEPGTKDFLPGPGHRRAAPTRRSSSPMANSASSTRTIRDWNDQHGGPRDPQPGNIGGVQRDTQGAPEDMANPPDCGCDFQVPTVSTVTRSSSR